MGYLLDDENKPTIVPTVTISRKELSVFVILSFILLIYSFFVGQWNGEKRVEIEDEVRNQLPYCEEDEFLYPDNYKGPGKNDPADYECWHFEYRDEPDVRISVPVTPFKE